MLSIHPLMFYSFCPAALSNDGSFSGWKVEGNPPLQRGRCLVAIRLFSFSFWSLLEVLWGHSWSRQPLECSLCNYVQPPCWMLKETWLQPGDMHRLWTAYWNTCACDCSSRAESIPLGPLRSCFESTRNVLVTFCPIKEKIQKEQNFYGPWYVWRSPDMGCPLSPQKSIRV